MGEAAILLISAITLVGCRSPTSTGPVASQWESLPPVRVDTALTQALAYIADHHQDLSGGYDLRAGRMDGYWWFEFLLLPRTPDLEFTVKVHDNGDINAFGLAPSTEGTK